MIPNRVPSGRENSLEGEADRAGRGVAGPYRRPRRDSISVCGTTFSGDHRVAPPTSMYSMNRTSAPADFPNAIRSGSSSSLKPRITRAFSLIRSNPALEAASMPRRTSACESRPVNRRNRSGRSVSRLTVMRCSPAVRSRRASGLSLTPFVVIARSRIPGCCASASTRRCTSRRSSGSPPVSRNADRPRPVKTSTNPRISSNERRSARGSHW